MTKKYIWVLISEEYKQSFFTYWASSLFLVIKISVKREGYFHVEDLFPTFRATREAQSVLLALAV